jgi:hypothetical protein
LAALAAQGVLVQAPAIPDDHPARLVDPHDGSQSLDDRARSYLHGNCAMCHHPGGNAIVSFYLLRDMPLEKLNTNKGTGIGTFGLREARIIAPGDPYRSLLLYRMSKLGYARMPYIGSHAVDSAGAALVRDWIASLEAQPGDPVSPPLRADSEEGKTLAALAEGLSGGEALSSASSGDACGVAEASRDARRSSDRRGIAVKRHSRAVRDVPARVAAPQNARSHGQSADRLEPPRRSRARQAHLL